MVKTKKKLFALVACLLIVTFFCSSVFADVGYFSEETAGGPAGKISINADFHTSYGGTPYANLNFYVPAGVTDGSITIYVKVYGTYNGVAKEWIDSQSWDLVTDCTPGMMAEFQYGMNINPPNNNLGYHYDYAEVTIWCFSQSVGNLFPTPTFTVQFPQTP